VQHTVRYTVINTILGGGGGTRTPHSPYLPRQCP